MFHDKDEVSDALALLVKYGLLDAFMREDGEWLYGLSTQAMLMSEDEKMNALVQAFEADEENGTEYFDEF